MKVNSRIFGAVLTVAFHALLMTVCVSSGLKYIYPPPEEKSMVIEFEREEEQPPVEVKPGVEPRAENPDPEREVRLVQRSEAPLEGTGANEALESTVGQDGDVEVPEPPRKEIDRRALFTTAANNKKDTLAAQTASELSDNLKEGHSQGNTRNGSTEGEPSARLAGRSVMGSLPLPDYEVSEQGRIVVDIQVDKNGNVVYANPGASGTSISSARLREAAKQAALKAKFSVASSENAPEIQKGTITYIFRMK